VIPGAVGSTRSSTGSTNGSPALLALLALIVAARIVLAFVGMQSPAWPVHATAATFGASGSQALISGAVPVHDRQHAAPRSATSPDALTPPTSRSVEQTVATNHAVAGAWWVTGRVGPPYRARGP